VLDAVSGAARDGKGESAGAPFKIGDMSDPVKPGDVLSFRFGDVLPADDPLSEWLILLAMALNDVALVNDRLERDYDSPHEYLYWLRLGVAHFFEAARLLKRGRDVQEVAAYIATLAPEVRGRYDACVSIYDERHEELKMIRDVLSHYGRRWTRRGRDPEHVIRSALEQLADSRTTMKTGTLREARLLFADDVAAAIFTRATGVRREDVAKDEVQEHVGRVQKRIEEAVTAFVRFANPALMEHFGRAMAAGVPVQRVEPVDPQDWRKGWRVTAT
jgi:hypothetical protein